MLLKRVFDGNMKMVGVNILRASRGRQKFRPELFMGSISQGWASIKDGKYTIHNSAGDDAVYTVVSKPGYYCCHDEAPLSDENVAKAYVAEKFAGVASPDKQNPAGYRKQNYYLCNKEN